MPASNPGGIAIVALLYFLWAVILFLLTFGQSSFVFWMFADEKAIMAYLTLGLAAPLRPLMPFVAAIAVLLGWGLLNRKDWAHLLTVALATLGILQAVFSLAVLLVYAFSPFRSRFGILPLVVRFSQLAIGVWIIWYLLRPNVKAAFQEKVSAI